jgi:hypothetical protein
MKMLQRKDYDDAAQLFLNGFWMGMGFLLIWALGWFLGRDWIYERHRRYFKIAPKDFDAMHYYGMMSTKVLVMMVFLVPYLAIKALTGCPCGESAAAADDEAEPGSTLPRAIPATRGPLQIGRPGVME